MTSKNLQGHFFVRRIKLKIYIANQYFIFFFKRAKFDAICFILQYKHRLIFKFIFLTKIFLCRLICYVSFPTMSDILKLYQYTKFSLSLILFYKLQIFSYFSYYNQYSYIFFRFCFIIDFYRMMIKI